MLNNKLNFLSIFFFLSLLIFSSVQANPSIYGRFDIAVSNVDNANKGSNSDVKSHASRIGIKGSQIFDNGLSIIYQYEWQTDPIDGDPTFKQRNSFIGLKSAFGEFIVGMYDTPVKKAQGKIDLFNDTAGDIKNILWGENRSKKIVQWSSPSLSGFKINLMAIMEDEEDEAFSLSIDWSTNLVGNQAKFSLAFDSEVPQKGYFFDTTRFSASIPLGKPTTLGIIWQESEDITGTFDDDGYIVSLKSKLMNKLSLKLMYGESDMIKSGGELIGVGFDYKIVKPLKLYVNYVEKNFNDIEKSSEELMFGIQYKFDFGLF